jgi:MYXO-CTERM domain-containing protein
LIRYSSPGDTIIMKRQVICCATLLAILTALSPANAATYYAKPGGSGSTCGATNECSVGTAAGKASAGDTVILRDGNYGKSSLSPANSGNESAWITFQADENATPIFEGGGVGNSTSQYIKYIGIVSRYNQYGGFGNGWIASCNNNTSTSNGYLQYINCIADGNGINGIAHYCATGLLIQQSILAHNGNGADSWSSAVNLYGVTGGTSANIVRETVSFDTIDTSSTHSSSGKATDGSGFILDQGSQGATFINNVGFENGGSCIRLTNSANSMIVNNTCYGNGKDPLALYNDEILYSDATSRTGASLLNNVIVVTTTGKSAIGNASGITQASNVTNATASSFVGVPGAANVDFNLTSSAATLVDKGGTSNAPTSDIGFDPKCIKQGTLSGSNLPSWLSPSSLPSWWTYVIDYAYIQQQGGVAKCFGPRTRTGAPDIGAFEYNGSPGTGGTPGIGGTPGTGGSPGTGGATATGGVIASGGATPTGGTTSAAATGGKAGTGGMNATGGSVVGTAAGGATAKGGAQGAGGGLNAGGSLGITGGTTAATGGALASGGDAVGSGGSAGTAGDPGTENAGGAGGTITSTNSGGCSCRVVGQPPSSRSMAGLGVLGLMLVGRLRRRGAIHRALHVPPRTM